MRKLLYILLTAVALTLVMGCSRSVDKRLVLADTLMWTAPDSSLKILTAINRDSLQDKENLAYHALLLTQAQFRCNGNCESDTLINLALSHYSDNHNREHYTRALLYKGSFYEVHDNPVEAIKWYKRAEDNADTTDYRNLAQINLRMGKLYYDNYASNNLDLEKFKKAYKYYNESQDKRMSMIVLGYMGNIYRANDHKKAIECLNKAKDIAKNINDKNSYYFYLNELSLAFFLDSSFVSAKKAVVECINNGNVNNAVCFNAASAYSALLMPDSARYYISKTEKSKMSAHDSMMYYFTLGRIHAAEGNSEVAFKLESQGNKISEAIAKSSCRDSIFKAEDEQMIYNIDLKENIMYRQKRIIIWVLVIAGMLLLLFLTHEILSVRKRNSLMSELNQNKEVIDKLLDEYKGKASIDGDNKELHNAIVSYLERHIYSLKSLIEQSKSIKYSDFIKLLNEKSSQLGDDKDMSKLLKMLADDKFNNLISYFSQKYPVLNENELRIISLISLGYDNDGIAFCTGMTRESVRTKKTRIKNKMELDMALDAFVTQEKLIRSSK